MPLRVSVAMSLLGEMLSLAFQFAKASKSHRSKLDLHILHAIAAISPLVGDRLFQQSGVARPVDLQMKALHLIDHQAAQSRVGRVQCVKLPKLAKRVIARLAVELLVGAEE
jgi:hypothetical protein